MPTPTNISAVKHFLGRIFQRFYSMCVYPNTNLAIPAQEGWTEETAREFQDLK